MRKLVYGPMIPANTAKGCPGREPGHQRFPRTAQSSFLSALLFLPAALTICSCPLAAQEAPPLRTLAETNGLMIGSVGDRGFRLTGQEGARFRTVLSREFGVLTAENDMKFARVRPARGQYDFGWADSLVAFAAANGMKMRGHTLVWHRQLAPWLTRGQWTREEARRQLEEHVTTVVRHFRGRLLAWDVVNEAIDDDGSQRSTFWSEHVGPDYIEFAFRVAHAADPDVPLFYNDYGIESINPKSDSVYALLKRLLDRGVPVHGIGFQGHFEVGQVPAKEELAKNFARFAALGLKIQITELDIRVPLPATEEHARVQAENYHDVIAVCLEIAACDTVVTWGFTDAFSWIPGQFPGFGAAHLFDENYEPKPAYSRILELLRQSRPVS